MHNRFMSQPTHYEVLGLAQDAPQEEVKRAFRRMAMARHPDLNPADPQASRSFRQVVAAYEVLGNERARSAYDASLRRVRGRGRGFREAMETVVSPEARAVVRINHAQAARGVRLTVDIPVGRPCPDCAGVGRIQRARCSHCGGTGRVARCYGPVSEEVLCPVCAGAGRRRGPCPRCGGSGRLGDDLACVMDIAPGAMDGDVHLLTAGSTLVEVVVRIV
jgi:molecular chaperone DnaJ